MREWGDFSYFSILKEVFHQFFDQENMWFGRRCWLFSAWSSLMLNGVILAILSLHNAGSLIIKFLLKRIYGLEEDVS